MSRHFDSMLSQLATEVVACDNRDDASQIIHQVLVVGSMYTHHDTQEWVNSLNEVISSAMEESND